MMKWILTAVLLLSVALSGQAQLIHVKGIEGVSVESGVVLNGYHAGVGYNKYFSNRIYGKGMLSFESATRGATTQHLYLGVAEGGYTVKRFGQNIYTNVIAEVGFGGENLKNSVSGSSKGKLVVMEGLGVGAEWCVSESITINLAFVQRFFQLSNSGKNAWQVKTGINYNF